MKEIIELIELSNQLHEKHRLRIERLEKESFEFKLAFSCLGCAILIFVLLAITVKL